MSDLADFLIEALFWFLVAFVVIGAAGGWLFVWFVCAREDARTKEANLHAREDIVRANPINVRDIRV